MGRRHTSNLNYKYRLNPRPVYDFMEKHNMTFLDLAERIGCHEQSIYNSCKARRIPSPVFFKRWQEVMGLTESDLLLPLVGGGRG